MLLLRYGDRTATVGLVQRIVNLCRSTNPMKFGGIRRLTEDGVYGSKTRKAVRTFQRALEMPKGACNGVFDSYTWSLASHECRCCIVDVVDHGTIAIIKRKGLRGIRKLLLTQMRKQFPKSPHLVKWKVEYMMEKIRREPDLMQGLTRHLKEAGSSPLELDDDQSHYQRIRQELSTRARNGWQVILLRIYGHGSAGRMGIVGSLVGGRVIDSHTLQMSDDDTAEDFANAVAIGGMTMPMCSWGTVELHGCSVAARRPSRKSVTGPAFVQLFANSIGRPVVTSTISNYVATAKQCLRFEGPTVTAAPGGGKIETWFKNHPIETRGEQVLRELKAA